MRKQVLVLVFTLLTAVVFTACKSDSKNATSTDEVKTETEGEQKADALADNTLYQCPMDCEDGKSYTEKGNCPVCKMDLKAKKVELESSEANDDSAASEHN